MPKKPTIVIAVDDSGYTKFVAEAGAKFCSLMGANPIIVSVVKKSVPITIGQKLQEELAKQEESEFESLHRNLEKRYFSGESKPSFEILHGDPGDEICELAEDEKADMIILGTRGRGRLSSALLGSVSAKVIREAKCPVLVVKA